MKKNVLFSLPAEALTGAEKIFVVGDFNNWTSQDGFELEFQSDGSASVIVPLETGNVYHYRFLINGNTWVNDYHAERYEAVQGYGIDNCVITVAELESGSKPGKSASSKSPKKATAKKPASKKTTKKVTATNARASKAKASKPKGVKKASSVNKKEDSAKPE